MADLTFVEAGGAVSDAGELLAGLAAEAKALGAGVTWSSGFPLTDTDTVYVFAPGDVYGMPAGSRPSRRQLRRAIAVCESAPTGALDSAYLNARRAAAAITPAPEGAALMRRHGVPTAQIRLGFTPAWEAARNGGPDPAGAGRRTIDVACFERREPGADRLLASFGLTLWKRRCWLVGAPDVPGGRGGSAGPPLPLGDERRRVLRESRVLLAGLGGESPQVELLRGLQAASNGVIVVASHACELGPLTAGSHFVAGERRNLGLLADQLLREPERVEEMRRTARAAVREGPSLTPAAEELMDVAGRVRSIARRSSRRPTAIAADLQVKLSEVRNGVRDRLAPPPNPRRVARKREALQEIAARRSQAIESAASGPVDPRQAVVLHATPAYRGARPRISVCVPAFEDLAVERAMASVAGSQGEDFELLVLDDASSDETAATALAFLEQRPWLPALLLGRRVNQGLGRGRTDMARLARGELLFMLDADNEVYPPALNRLAAALEEDTGATFAYPLIEAHTDGRPRALLSALPWDPQRLRRGNYIDAMAMIRRSALLEAGGYTEDLRLHGWEDFDLWCRLAAAGRRGRMVPEILCRYSFSEESMISVTNLDSSDAWSLLRERYPTVLGGAPLPEWPPPPPDQPL